jgi:hypothetical protein
MRGRFEADGEDGVLDRRVGKPSPRRIGAAEVARVVSLCRERYLGCKPPVSAAWTTLGR